VPLGQLPKERCALGAELPLELAYGCTSCTIRDDLLVLLCQLHRRDEDGRHPDSQARQHLCALTEPPGTHTCGDPTGARTGLRRPGRQWSSRTYEALRDTGSCRPPRVTLPTLPLRET
jgi:hypothetical protein